MLLSLCSRSVPTKAEFVRLVKVGSLASGVAHVLNSTPGLEGWRGDSGDAETCLTWIM
jgi:hypothetical protein